MITPAMASYGLDERFNRFVVGTMVWTVSVGLLVMALAALLNTGPDGGVAMAGVYLFFGALIAAPIALLAYTFWFRPSTIVFGRIFRSLRGRLRDSTAAMIAGTVTALIGSLAFYVIATVIARDFDGLHAFIILFGPVSLLVAPVMARRIYRDGDQQPSQGIQ